MTWLVLTNNAPSFDELKAMYLKLGGKDNVAGLTKCHLAHMIDLLTIIKENKADILKLADDILGTETADREYDE